MVDFLISDQVITQVMKPLYTSVLAVLVTVTIVGILGTQQIYAPRTCAGCAEFKKLTTEFEKAVIDAAAQPPPEGDKIQMLLDDYSDAVMALFRSPSPSP